MRGETDFRVKGENIGQPEVIFRKMIFSMTAKHAEKGENDFLKSFSPKTNAPFVTNTQHSSLTLLHSPTGASLHHLRHYLPMSFTGKAP